MKLFVVRVCSVLWITIIIFTVTVNEVAAAKINFHPINRLRPRIKRDLNLNKLIKPRININLPDISTCGKNPGYQPKQNNLQNRIISGKISEINKYPFLVSLRQCPTCIHTCGGSIISNKHVISSAHCVIDDKFIYHSYVVYGEFILSESQTLNSVKTRDVRIHEKFDDKTYENALYDFSILELSVRLVFSDAVQPICLSSSTKLTDSYFYYNSSLTQDQNKYLQIAGWGLNSENLNIRQKYPGPLIETQLSIKPMNICKEIYKLVPDVEINDDQYFCTYDHHCFMDKSCKDACQGDSGGPVFFKDPNTDQFILLGIISFGVGCGRLKWPGVSIKINNEIQNWITSHSNFWREDLIENGITDISGRPLDLFQTNFYETSFPFWIIFIIVIGLIIGVGFVVWMYCVVKRQKVSEKDGKTQIVSVYPIDKQKFSDFLKE